MAHTYVVVGIVGGALAGGVQTPLLRQYADNPMAVKYLANPSGTPPVLMEQLKGFGSLSALAGIGLGIGGLAGGYLAGKHVRQEGVSEALYAYGATSLGGGIASGAFPTTQWAAATAADPPAPALPSPRSIRVTPASTRGIGGPTASQLAAQSAF